MRDPGFDRDVRESMKTLQTIVRVNGKDGALAVIRMIHHFALVEVFSAPAGMGKKLIDLAGVCLVALGGEEMPSIPSPEVPNYRATLPWDPYGLKCNLEACRRVGLRHGALSYPPLKEWLDYVIAVCDQQQEMDLEDAI